MSNSDNWVDLNTAARAMEAERANPRLPAIGDPPITPGALASNICNIHNVIRWLGKSPVPWDIASFEVHQVGEFIKQNNKSRYTPGWSLTYQLPPQGITAFLRYVTTRGRAFVVPFGTTSLGEHWCGFSEMDETNDKWNSAQLFSYYKRIWGRHPLLYPMEGAVVLGARDPSRNWEIAIDTVDLQPGSVNVMSAWRVAVSVTLPNGCVYGFNAPDLGEWNGVWGHQKPNFPSA